MLACGLVFSRGLNLIRLQVLASVLTGLHNCCWTLQVTGQSTISSLHKTYIYIGFGATLKVGGGGAHNASEARMSAHCSPEGASPSDGVEKFLKSKTEICILATLYQVFLKKIKIPYLPVVFFSADVTPN